jgi:hypothetical protein
MMHITETIFTVIIGIMPTNSQSSPVYTGMLDLNIKTEKNRNQREMIYNFTFSPVPVLLMGFLSPSPTS